MFLYASFIRFEDPVIQMGQNANAKNSPNSKGNNVLKKIVTSVFPGNKLPKETISPTTAKAPLRVSFDLDGPAEKDQGHSTLPPPPHRRSRSYSSLSKLEYNPYGIYNHHEITSLGSAFDHGPKTNEGDLRLSNPLSQPNDYLPARFQQDSTNLEEKYELLQNDIETGGSAVIKKVVLKDHSADTVFALKKFSLFSGETQDKYYNRVAYEYIITRNFCHVHCIRCYDLLQLPVTLQNAWGMTMDYYSYDLFKLIRKYDWKSVPLDEKLCIFKQVCFGVKYLHECDIVHLDIKADNVLVAPNGLMKIIDFGCSESGHVEFGNFSSAISYKSTRVGTPPYQAPEVSKYHPVKKESRTPFCPFHFDYWSLGILLFVLVMGKAPFSEAKEADPGYKIFTMEYTRFLETNPLFSQDKTMKTPKEGVFGKINGRDPNFVYLFWRLCDPNPKTRMTLPKLFKNPFFQKIAMCVDEKLYQCNFANHVEAKDMAFKIPQDSKEEITLQREIKHSSWDDIPTIESHAYQYRSMVNPATPFSQNRNRPATTATDASRKPCRTNSLLKLSQREHSKSRLALSFDPNANPDLHCAHKHSSSSSSRSASASQSETEDETSATDLVPELGQHKDGSHYSFQNLKTGGLHHSFHAISRLPTANPQDKTPGLELSHSFRREDYANQATGFMIVDFKDIIAACDCKILPHSHNILYEHKRQRSFTVGR